MLPLALLRRPSLYAIGAAGAVAAGLVLAALLDLPAREAALLFPVAFLMYVSSACCATSRSSSRMRPVLEDIGERLPERVAARSRAGLAAPAACW